MKKNGLWNPLLLIKDDFDTQRHLEWEKMVLKILNFLLLGASLHKALTVGKAGTWSWSLLLACMA